MEGDTSASKETTPANACCVCGTTEKVKTCGLQNELASVKAVAASEKFLICKLFGG